MASILDVVQRLIAAGCRLQMRGTCGNSSLPLRFRGLRGVVEGVGPRWLRDVVGFMVRCLWFEWSWLVSLEDLERQFELCSTCKREEALVNGVKYLTPSCLGWFQASLAKQGSLRDA